MKPYFSASLVIKDQQDKLMPLIFLGVASGPCYSLILHRH